MSAQPWIPGDDELDALARGLPAPERAAERTEQGRANLLASAGTIAQQPRSSRTPWVAAVAAAVAAAAILLVWLVARPGRTPAAKESITPIGVAQFGRASAWPDFMVRVDDGKVAIEVAPLADGERFRVKTADAEVEVRGTKFIVGAERGRLTSVAVSEGRVEVRWAHEPPVFLSAGDTWTPVQTAERDLLDRPSTATTNEPTATTEPTATEPTKGSPTTATAKGPDAGTTTATAATRTRNAPSTATSRVTTTPGPTAKGPIDPPAATKGSAMTKRPTTATMATKLTLNEVTGPNAATPATAKGPNAATNATTTTTAPNAATNATTKTPSTPTTGTSAEVPTAKPVTAPSPGESDFRAGIASLRGGDAAAATRSFATACQAAQRDALGEDACFWLGAAARRAGQMATARDALTKFLTSYPRSARAGEAAALLGWMLYEAGQLDAAEQRFSQAAADRVPQVRDSAVKGLEAIKRTRAGGK